ncbi:MAG: hypothetical protein M1826_006338 [Phylliscum demangeonii]|nr:MAG: hypothetical protein M1826_006338 [Phylliscum demangeonii]
MKSGSFVRAAAALSAILALALARPVPDHSAYPEHSKSQVAGNLALYTGAGAVLGMGVASGLYHHKVQQAKAETVATKAKLSTAEKEVDRVKADRDRVTADRDLAHVELRGLRGEVQPTNGALRDALKDAEAQALYYAKYGYNVGRHHNQEATQMLVSRCWFHELEMAVRRSSAATWADSIGDDMWEKCIRFHPSPAPAAGRPARDFKKAGAAMQKKRGLFQPSAPPPLNDQPLAFLQSPAVQHQIHQLQKMGAVGLRDVHALMRFGAKAEVPLERAAARLQAGEV